MSSFTIKPLSSIKKLKIWLLKISFGVLFVVFGIFGVFSDVFAWEESFEDYALGSDLDSQGGWVVDEMEIMYENYTTGDNAGHKMYGVVWRGQTFTPTTPHKITNVKLLLYRDGNPGTTTVSIRATSGGFPILPDLCLGITDGNTLPTASPYEWRTITFDTGCDLNADVRYAIVIRAPDGDNSNCVLWRADETSPTYTEGIMVYSTTSGGNGTWSSPMNWDMMFEERGLGGWILIQDTKVKTGEKAIFTNYIASNYSWAKGTSTDAMGKGRVSFWVQSIFGGADTDGLIFTIGTGITEEKIVELRFEKEKEVYYLIGTTPYYLGEYFSGVWTKMEIEWVSATKLVRYNYNNLGWTDWVNNRENTDIPPFRLSFTYVRYLSVANWYVDDVSFEGVCSPEFCDKCEDWFNCQVVGCCWYYQPWYAPPFDNYCDVCEGECSYPYNCGLCATETTCEATGCFWTGDYCTQFEWECGGELACQFCDTQETCEAEGCNWNIPTGTCWYAVPTLPSSWSTYYNLHGGYATSSEFVNELAETTGETFIIISGLFEGFITSFDTADALAKGSAMGNVIPKGRGYLKIIDGLFGHYPIGEIFVFILIFMLAIGLFRIARQLIQLIKP